MTSDRQKAANRLNAQNSTGPKSETGRKRAALNALRHGLTTPLDSTAWATKLGAIESLLVLEGLCGVEARELALCLVDYERNAVHQRKLYLETLSGVPFAQAILDGAEAYIDVSRSSSKATGFGESGLPGEQHPLSQAFQHFFAIASPGQIRLAKRDAAREFKSTDRYLRRAANQLIKALKRV